ncbi:S-adenosyl-L-methionine dependent methyltransferase [Trichoderma novae-zelandiae]
MDHTPLEGIDVSRPSVARMYDVYLGGKNNYASDRAAVAAVKEALPNIFEIVAEGRHFLRRVIRYMCHQGIDQFIDIGSGLPSADNTHQVAQRVNPDARVVYVDIDDAAVVQGRQILNGNPSTAFIQGSVVDLEPILNHPETRNLIDFSKPVGVVMMGLLHFFDVDTDRGILKVLRENLASGSLVSFTHGVLEFQDEDAVRGLLAAYARTPTPLIMRTMGDIEKIMEGFVPVEPGLVLLHDWKMELAEEGEPEPSKYLIWAGTVLEI